MARQVYSVEGPCVSQQAPGQVAVLDESRRGGVLTYKYLASNLPRRPLQPAGDVYAVAEYREFHAACAADIAQDDRTEMDADRQAQVVRRVGIVV